MVGVDTNVLLRFIVRDDELQFARAKALVGGSAEASLFISDVVLCETVWTLKKGYGLAHEERVAALRGFLQMKQFAFEDRLRTERAVDAFAAGAGDFADYVIRERALDAGCEAVATFDRDLHRESGFRAP